MTQTGRKESVRLSAQGLMWATRSSADIAALPEILTRSVFLSRGQNLSRGEKGVQLDPKPPGRSKPKLVAHLGVESAGIDGGGMGGFGGGRELAGCGGGSS